VIFFHSFSTMFQVVSKTNACIHIFFSFYILTDLICFCSRRRFNRSWRKKDRTWKTCPWRTGERSFRSMLPSIVRYIGERIWRSSHYCKLDSCLSSCYVDRISLSLYLFSNLFFFLYYFQTSRAALFVISRLAHHPNLLSYLAGQSSLLWERDSLWWFNSTQFRSTQINWTKSTELNWTERYEWYDFDTIWYVIFDVM
jgi:hypothetical protein